MYLSVLFPPVISLWLLMSHNSFSWETLNVFSVRWSSWDFHVQIVQIINYYRLFIATLNYLKWYHANFYVLCHNFLSVFIRILKITAIFEDRRGFNLDNDVDHDHCHVIIMTFVNALINTPIFLDNCSMRSISDQSLQLFKAIIHLVYIITNSNPLQ